jgi:multicomponent Na+:H+ antiporter subunit G
MDLILNALSWVCIIAGGVFCLISGIGLVRMPDVFTRIHAASVGDTMGVGLIILGLLFQAGLAADLVGIKLILILVFLLFTGPVATHALAQAALLDGEKPWTRDGGPTEGTLDRADEPEDAFIQDVRGAGAPGSSDDQGR